MRRGILATVLCAGIVVAGLGVGSARAAEPYRLETILPLTGNAAFVGNGQKVVLEVLAKTVNDDGGIGGRPVQFVFHDDQSNPQTAVQLASAAIADHPVVVLGSSIVAMCNAMAPLFMHDGPVMLCLSPGYHPPPHGWIFTSGSDTADTMVTLLGYFRQRGWTKVALMTSTDATGQDADRSLQKAIASYVDMSLVEQTHFNITDLSVAAQVERTKEAKPDVFIGWSTGTALATIFKGIVQTGLDVPVGTTAGNFVYAQMAHFAGVVPKQLYVAGNLFPRHDGVYTLDPRLEAVQHKFYAAMGDVPPDNMAGTSWDLASIAIAGLRAVGPGATARQLRDYIANLKDYPGIDGFYDFTKVPDRGLDRSSTVVVQWDATSNRFVWASAPGGAPLAAH
jgi:branched-chain amino acid transport system substrate-binding protein